MATESSGRTQRRAEVSDGVSGFGLVAGRILDVKDPIILLKDVPVVQQHHHCLKAVQLACSLERIFLTSPIACRAQRYRAAAQSERRARTDLLHTSGRAIACG